MDMEKNVTDLKIAQLDMPPDMIDFSAGQPSPSLLPLASLQKAAADRLSGHDASFLAYGAEQGDGYFRTALAGFLSEHYGFHVGADQLFIAAGASMGLDLICTLFARAGDTIFVEEPSFFLALRIFADHHLNIVSLPMDAYGLIPQALEKALTRHRPVFLYSVPTFHNPSSVTLAAERRRQLVELSRKYDFLILADEVYHLLNYADAPPPPPMASYIDSNTVFSLGSFSKIMAPGLRLGWVQAGAPLVKRLSGCGLLDSGGGLNPFTSAVMRSALEMGLQHIQLTTLKTIYTKRKIALIRALRKNLPETVRFIEPDGGFFTWLVFPEEVDTKHMLAEARRRNVGYLPGGKFSSLGKLKNCARLCFAYFDVPELEEGARRLGEVLKSYLQMRP